MPIQCDYVGKGCPWEGTISDIEQHLQACSFAIPYQLKLRGREAKESSSCQKKCCPKNQVKPLGNEEKIASAFIESRVKKIGSKKQPICLNFSPPIGRSGITAEKRKSSIPQAMVASKYNSLGPPARLQRKDAQNHEQAVREVHLTTALQKLARLSEETSTLKHGEYFAFKMAGFNDLKQKNKTFHSECFYSCQRYKLRVLVDCNGCYQAKGTHLSVAIEIMKGCYDRELEWPFHGVVSLVLLNQLADDCHVEQMIGLKPQHYSAHVGSVAGIWRFIPHSELLVTGSPGSVQYLVNDTLYFRAKVDTVRLKPWLSVGKIDVAMNEMVREYRMMARLGKKTIKITHFSKLSTSAVSSFSIEPGYSAILALSPNNKHLCLSLSVSKRPFWHTLETPVATVQVELLNQLADNNHHSKCLETVTCNAETATVTYKSAEFVSMVTLSPPEGSRTQYLKNDCLFFRVSLSLSKTDDRPWLDTREKFTKLYTITTKKV